MTGNSTDAKKNASISFLSQKLFRLPFLPYVTMCSDYDDSSPIHRLFFIFSQNMFFEYENELFRGFRGRRTRFICHKLALMMS